MRLDQRVKRLQRRRTGADLVGQRRDGEFDAFAGIALALPVERLMLAELLEQDHGQKVGPGKTARRRMERRRRLRDRLARPAGELLAHRLDDLPPARNNLQRLGDVFAELRQLRRAARRAACRRRDHHALARQMRRKRFARWALALRRRRAARPGRGFLGQKLILGRGCLQLFELKLHLLQEPRLALRADAVKRAPAASRSQASDERSSRPRSRSPPWPEPPRKGGRRARRGSSRERRQDRREEHQGAWSQGEGITIRQRLQRQTVSQPKLVSRFFADCANRSRKADSQAARAKSRSRRQPGSATKTGPAPDAS